MENKKFIRKEKYMDEITSYIKKNLSKGYTRDSLKWALVGQGYPKLEVEKALTIVDKEMAKSVPAIEKPKIDYEITPIQEEKKSFWKKLFG